MTEAGRLAGGPDSRPHVVVIGAGIAGLAAAWRLSEHARVTVLEASDRVGGKLRLGSLAGVTVDVGAEAILARRPEGASLARAAALGPELVDPLTTDAAIFAGGRRFPIPAGTAMGVPAGAASARTSGLLSSATLDGIDREPQRPPLPPLTDDVAIGELVRERLGDEVVDRLVEPLLGGVYAGRANELSLAATTPALAQALRGGGSLVEAARASHGVSHSSGPVFTAVRGGVGRLPEALAESGRFAVRTGLTVRSVRRSVPGFALTCGPVSSPERIDADAVVVATPAAKAAGLLRDVVPSAAGELAAVEAASVAVVSLAYPQVSLPPGSGLLVAAREPFAVKGVTISSQKWPGTPPDLTLVRASLGRAGETRDLQRDDDELIALARHDLATLLPLDAAPVDAMVTRWGGGLPQYAVGHVDRVRRIRAAVAEVPGLAVCGATFDGIGIPACIASANRAADLIMEAWSTASARAN